jgi:hypothetical protein
MGEHIVRRGQSSSPQPSTTRRLTAEIPAQQLHELIGDTARGDLEAEPDLVDVEVLPAFLPEATPTDLRSTSAQLLARRGGPRAAVTFAMRPRQASAVPQAPIGARADISTIAMPRGDRAATAHPARYARVMSQVGPPASCVAPGSPATSAAPAGPGSSWARPRPNMMVQRLRLIDVTPFGAVTRRWPRFRGAGPMLLILPFVLLLLTGGSLAFWLVRFLR